MSRSTPSSSSARAGARASSAGWTVTGRRLANRPSPPRSANSACSGRTAALRVVPRRAADGAEQHRVRGAAGGQVLVADRDAVGVDRGAAGDVLGPGELETEARARRRRGRGAPAATTSGRPRRRGSWRSGRRALGAAAHGGRSGAPGARGTTNATLDAVDLGAVQLVDGHEVRLERRLDDVRGQAVTGDDQGARPLVGRAPAADQYLALGVLAGAHRLDLVFGQRGMPAEHRLERLRPRPRTAR